VTLRRIHNPGAPATLKLGALEVTAFSVSGLATYVLVPSFDACFDLGHCPAEGAHLRHVFLSHVHQDHAGGVHRHLSLRAMQNNRPSRIFCPAESAPALVDLLRAWERLEERPPADLDACVHPVAAGDTLALNGRMRVRAFDVVHRIASRGYTVIETRRSLRAEYRGMPGAEIHAARLRGETVHDEREHNAFTYIGDSTLETLRRHPEVGQSEVLFLEATHLPGTSLATSERYGHTHLDELIALFHERPEVFASPHIVIKHFSMKYGERDIADAHRALPPELRRRVTHLVAR
jgi:ribonuclease BN (tRNA processing enzyme)